MFVNFDRLEFDHCRSATNSFSLQAPDISVDPRTKVLSLINPSTQKTKSFVVTVHNSCANKKGDTFIAAKSQDNNGVATTCTTFLSAVPPSTVLDVCRINVSKISDIQIHSDVHFVELHPFPGEDASMVEPSHVLTFPLEGGPFLCTQGVNGELTHFQLGTYHAIDFACAIGTVVLAGGDGTVHKVQHHNAASGISVGNLFFWNSVIIKLDSGPFVEYVHIRTGSAVVAEGERVTAGQKICESGAVGFCPEPHLHVQCHDVDDPTAPTVLCAFASTTGAAIVPHAGDWCSSKGIEPAPQ